MKIEKLIEEIAKEYHCRYCDQEGDLYKHRCEGDVEGEMVDILSLMDSVVEEITKIKDTENPYYSASEVEIVYNSYEIMFMGKVQERYKLLKKDENKKTN